MSAHTKVHAYYRLAKPGIVYGNSLHFLAGSFFALPSVWTLSNVAGGLVGTALLIASACVVNNVIDRKFDSKMRRTKSRPSASGEIAAKQALVYAAILLAIGLIVLNMMTNSLTLLLGCVAYSMYAVVYTYSKRITPHSTLIGTIPGALPAAAGYTATTGIFDGTAWALLGLIALWQLPHFYAIAVFRKQEYINAGLPVLSTVINETQMRRVIILTSILYLVAAVGFAWQLLLLPSAIMLVAIACYWVLVALRRDTNYAQWARRMFGVSMYASLVFVVSAMLSFALKAIT